MSEKREEEGLQKNTDEKAFNPGQKKEDLKRSEEWYYKMVEEVEDYAIILLDKDGIIQNWNKGAEKIKQYRESEVVGKSFHIFYLPADRLNKLPERLIDEAVRTGKALHEGWRLRKDQTRFWGSVALTALHDKENNIIGFSKVTRDLTERKLAEDQLKDFAEELRKTNEALRRSEERYHQMIAEVQDYAIILLNENGEIQNWNAGAESIKGYSVDEIVGRSFKIFYTKEDREQKVPEKLLEKAVTYGKAVHEGWRVRKDGSRFWGSIVITALHGAERKIIGFSKVTRDLTERKHAEDKMQEYLAGLELQNKELEQFAYVASHDLQEPLRKIQIFIELIATNPEDGAFVKKYFEKIDASARRMAELIKSVLNYSRLSKTADHMSDTDLNEVVENIRTDFELLISEKNGRIEHARLPVIRAIPLQMNQLFSNLIGNALKFTEKEPVIKISARNITKEEIPDKPANLAGRDYIEISIADNGIGFDQQYEKVIFSMFQRLHRKDEYSGTGIGLAICKKIMDGHDGFIAAKSDLARGSTFYLYFPAKIVS